MFTVQEKTMQSLENSLRLTLPIELYEDPYCIQRRKTILMFSNILDKTEKFKSLPYQDQVKIMVSLEKSCFDKTVDKCRESAIYVDWVNEKFSYLYCLTASRVSKNIDSSSEVEDSYLIDKIISNEIDPNTVASLPSTELVDPSNVHEINEKLDKRRSTRLIEKTTSMYPCRNCKGRNCTIRTQQMRSLDEGFSIIINCLDCKYRFIVSG